MQIPHSSPTLWKNLARLISFALMCSLIIYLGILTRLVNNLQTNVNFLIDKVTNLQVQSDQQYASLTFEAHLSSLNTFAMQQEKKLIEETYQELKSEANQEKLIKIEKVYTIYQSALEKIDRNAGEGLDTSNSQNKLSDWGKNFLEQKFDELVSEIESENQSLDESYQALLAQRAAEERARQQTTPTSAPAPTQDASTFSQGYASLSVNTDIGTFATYVVKYPLSSVRVLTLTANENDCTNNCPAKSLAEYVSENSGFAGIHGTYFCPPDYASCANKTYSYDYAVYNSNLGKWLNEVSLTWQNLGLLKFVETQVSLENHYNFDQFYMTPSVTTGIVNYPSLVSNSELVAENFTLTSYQTTKGYRGAIGFDNSNLYLAIASGASVPDMAHIMKALGATNALNLDGGGSSALYYEGSYKVGPGRLLPNAIILQKR